MIEDITMGIRDEKDKAHHNDKVQEEVQLKTQIIRFNKFSEKTLSRLQNKDKNWMVNISRIFGDKRSQKEIVKENLKYFL